MKQPFAVKSNSFNLYEAFRKDCESMGWTENKDFGHWGIENFKKGFILCFGHRGMPDRNYIYFEWNYEGRNFDVEIIFNLETHWNEALQAAKEWFKEEEKPKEKEWVKAEDGTDLEKAGFARLVIEKTENATVFQECQIVSTKYGLLAVSSFPVEPDQEWEILK